MAELSPRKARFPATTKAEIRQHKKENAATGAAGNVRGGMRMRNVGSEGEKRRLLEAIAASDAAAQRKGQERQVVDTGVKPFVPGKRARVQQGGVALTAADCVAALEEVMVRRSDGGIRLEVLSEPWAGADPVVIRRERRADVPALLANGELVIIEEEPGWAKRHKEYVKISRGGEEPCSGFVQKHHLAQLSIASHPKDWVQPKGKPDLLPNCKFLREHVIKDARGCPKLNVKWKWNGRDLSCPVRLAGARDLTDGKVVAAAQIFQEKRHTADIVSGWGGEAPPTQVSVLPR